MAIDVRQIGGAFLTLSMFAMLGNMIRKDHFSDNTPALEVSSSNASNPLQDARYATNKLLAKGKEPENLWGLSAPALKPCWEDKITESMEKNNGFVSFTLSNGPSYHLSQVADAVVVAKYLGATLILPQIKESSEDENSKFEQIYDADKFIDSLSGVVKVARQLPNNKIARKTVIVRIPHRVTEQYISENVEPLFRKKRSIMLSIVFPSIDMKIKQGSNSEMESIRCLGMYGALEFRPEIRMVGDKMLKKLRDAEDGSSRHFVAVDLRMDILLHRGCENADGSLKSGTKKCFGAQDVGIFLRKIGFQEDTPLYLTESTWHENLNSLKDIFPNVYTKETSMPSDEKMKLFHSGKTEFERALDFYICSQSDVFVPAISGMFYANVAGQRIAAGRTQILVPTTRQSSTDMLSDSISRYIIDKNHIAYSCFC
ncbi:protein MANNAN SYNTHESIS-RELATED 1 [Cryptomeria japonica]|uniref:protein MANNAN SYNTHESIS-RELATED 1 n=1 Tax=Cryptomeria japonica TaxID=3369 RepID=UPI0025ABE45A|nr:protein MANNAN SYNTHESIS-RELATED 1 [Cryptomeria japonica]